MLLACLSCSLATEVVVQAVEHGGPTLEAGFVIPLAHGDARDQPVDAGRLGTIELRVLQIDVVHDLRNWHECPVVETEARDEHLEGAEIALVRELGLEHVEAELPCLGLVALGRHELEGRILVDEATDEPGTGYAVDVNALSSDPDPLLRLGDGERARGDSGARWCRRRDALFQPGNEAFRCFAAWRAEEVDFDDLSETFAKASDCGRRRRARLVRERASAGRKSIVHKLADVRGESPVVLLPGAQEQAADFLVGETFYEPSLAERRLAAVLVNLTEHPFEVLAGLVSARKEIDGVLERDGAESLKAPPDLHPKIGRLRGKLMDEEEPGVRGHSCEDITVDSYTQRMYPQAKSTRFRDTLGTYGGMSCRNVDWCRGGLRRRKRWNRYDCRVVPSPAAVRCRRVARVCESWPVSCGELAVRARPEPRTGARKGSARGHPRGAKALPVRGRRGCEDGYKTSRVIGFEETLGGRSFRVYPDRRWLNPIADGTPADPGGPFD